MLKCRLTLVTVLVLVAASAAVFALRPAQVQADVTEAEQTGSSAIRTLESALALHSLPPIETRVVKSLLMLPVGALIVSFFRTFVGVPTFGSFAPVLLGVAFLPLAAIPVSLLIFAVTVLIGWKLRRVLDRYRLLQVSRFSALLTLVVAFLIVLTRVTTQLGVTVAQCLSLFPLAILTHTAERFWTMEAEAGARASFKTLMGTLFIAVCVSLVLANRGLTDWLFAHPEGLGLVLAAHLLIGRYTGYRLSELYRFRDLLVEPIEPEGFRDRTGAGDLVMVGTADAGGEGRDR